MSPQGNPWALESYGETFFGSLTPLRKNAPHKMLYTESRLSQTSRRPSVTPRIRPPVLGPPQEPEAPQEPGPGPQTQGTNSRVKQTTGRILALLFTSHDLGPLTYKPSGLSVSPPKRKGRSPLPPQSKPPRRGLRGGWGVGACGTQSLRSGAREGPGLQHFPAMLMGRLQRECGRRGRRRACRSDSAAPRPRRPGKPAGPFPPAGQGVPAGRLPAVGGSRGGRRGGAAGPGRPGSWLSLHVS